MRFKIMIQTVKTKKAFTLIEILLALGIIIFITTLSFAWFPSLIKKERVNKEMDALVSLLEQARSRTLSAKNASQYGVRTETDQIIFFEGSVYSAGAIDNVIHEMDSGVIISMGAQQTLIFEKITGDVVDLEEFLTINLSSLDYIVNRSMIIYPTGLIEKN